MPSDHVINELTKILTPKRDNASVQINITHGDVLFDRHAYSSVHYIKDYVVQIPGRF